MDEEVIKALLLGAQNLGDTVTFSGIVQACLMFIVAFGGLLGSLGGVLKLLVNSNDIKTSQEAIKVLQDAVKVLTSQVTERDTRIEALEREVKLRGVRISELEAKESMLETELNRLSENVQFTLERKKGILKQLETVTAERDKLQARTPLGGVHKMLDKVIGEGGGLPLSDKKTKANSESDNGKGASPYE